MVAKVKMEHHLQYCDTFLFVTFLDTEKIHKAIPYTVVRSRSILYQCT